MKRRRESKRQPRRASTQHPPAGEPRTRTNTFRRIPCPIEPIAPSRWPGISACMIVRNEAANLRPCLESLGDLASEIIVVDTGSTDDTIDIARSMGAQVFHFPWIDDFAAARNESLRHASKEWLFWLDADDRLSPEAVVQIKAAAASGKADAYTALVSSRKPNGSADVVEHVRLLRNGLGIRFSGSIHETVGPDILRLGLTLGETTITVVHTGYESPEVTRVKSQRNLPIIDRELSRHPERIDLLFYRGHCRRGVGDVDGAAADMRQFLTQTRPGPNVGWSRFWAFSALAFILEDKADHRSLETLLRQAMTEFPGHPHLLYMLGRCLLAAGRVQEALPRLRSAHEALERPCLGLRPSLAEVSMSLAHAHRAGEDRDEAIRWAQTALAEAPHWAEASAFLAVLYVELGSLERAEQLISPLLESTPSPEPWLALAEIRQRQRRWPEMEVALREARKRGLPEHRARQAEARLKADQILSGSQDRGGPGPAEEDAQLRGLALLSQGEPMKAAESFAEAIASNPTLPDNYRYLAAALERAGHSEEAIEAWRLAARWGAQHGTASVGLAPAEMRGLA